MYNTKEKCKELAEKFKQICAERGTTPYKIAQKSGLSSSTVSCFQAATTVPRVDTLMILATNLVFRSVISLENGKCRRHRLRMKKIS